MKRVILMVITSLGIYSSIYSQGLTNNQKEIITSQISDFFEEHMKAGENLDSNGLSSRVSDTLKAGFIDNGIFLNSFDEVMRGFNEGIQGVKFLKYSISNKKITVLADNVALLTASGNASLALEDGQYINSAVLGMERAKYGKQIVATVSRQLQQKYGKPFEDINMRRMMQFAAQFPDIEIVYSLGT
jgi:hypothetical protein